MPDLTYENSPRLLGNGAYPVLFVDKDRHVYTEKPTSDVLFQLPNMTAEQLGDPAFKATYGVKYALYGGAMARGIASADMVIALGNAGFMGSYGAGGESPDTVAAQIEKIQNALNGKPYLVNMLASRNPEGELALAQLLVEKNVPAVEASAYIVPSEALVYYRVKGLTLAPDGTVAIPHRIIAKVSREEVMERFLCPPADKALQKLLSRGLITPQEAELASRIPMADDITAEADSGGHTDGRPLVSMLPAFVALAQRKNKEFGYKTPVRVGAAGGIGTGLSCLGAFEMGAAYVVTGSVNQSCVEAGTSDYVKRLLAQAAMADVTMAPCADQFEQGTRVEVLKKATMYPQHAQKLYEAYTKYPAFDAVPDRDRIEARILKDSFEHIWQETKAYFSQVSPAKCPQAEQDPKAKMAMVFRWYLAKSAQWAILGQEDRKFDMQIWCGQAMGAFNLWVKGTPWEAPENRRVAQVARLLMDSCAYHYMRNLLIRMGVSADALAMEPWQANTDQRTPL